MPFESRDGKTPAQEASATLGFDPDLLVNVAGTTFRGEDGVHRQDRLKQAQELLRKYGSLPIRLAHDHGNKYDEYAVSVMLPTSDDAAGTLGSWKSVGFIPKKVCWVCFASLSGKKANSDICSECGAKVDDDRSMLNRYIVSILRPNFDMSSEDTGMLQFGLVWISAGTDGKSVGARLGLKFTLPKQGVIAS